MNLFELFVKIGIDDQASKELESISNKLGNGLKKAAKIGSIAVTTAAAGVTAFTTSAIKSYAEYEQLIGGAELMFGKAFDSVKKNAEDAYKTVQMSQSEYLKQVNGFATGLKTALGGNEEQAADLSHRIVQAEADIIAATGNTAENVQNAFNGIMRSNFTMLDNLQIGITPTKEGFQEVIDKVNEWNAANGNATKYQIGNLADMQSALIDYIEMQGYAGYAAKEAAKTISGSVASTKSAWKNLVAGVADDNADFDKLMDNFIESVERTGENILPRVRIALEGAAKLVSKFAPVIAKELPKLVAAVLPDLINAAADLVVGLTQALPSIAGALIKAANKVVDQIGTAISKKIPKLSFIFDNLREIVTATAAAFVAYKTAIKITSVIDTFTRATEGATIAQAALNAVMNLNPVFLVITTIAAAIGWLASMESSIKSVTKAQEDLNRARQEFIDAETDYTNAIVAEEEAIKELQDIEYQTGLSSKELADAVESGIISYKKMTAEQRSVYDAYLKLKKAQDTLRSSTNAFNEAKKNETIAHLENMLALSKESKDFTKYKKSVIDAFDGAEISAKEAQELIGKAMGQMSLSAMRTFVEDVPYSIRKGLNPNQYMNEFERMKRNFKYGLGDIKLLFDDLGNAIKNMFYDNLEWSSRFGESILEGIKNGIIKSWDNFTSWFNDLWDYSAWGGESFGGVPANITSAQKTGAGATSAVYGGTSIGSVTINVDGSKIDDPQKLAEIVAIELQNMTDGRLAAYA